MRQIDHHVQAIQLGNDFPPEWRQSADSGKKTKPSEWPDVYCCDMAGQSRFPTTSWSTVLAAGAPATRHLALETLCAAYWAPVYAFVCRQGNDPETAKDLTQSFFARLLEKREIEAARRDRGRFRSFLLACVKHFLTNEWDRVRAEKRGGGRPVVPLELNDAERSFNMEPADSMTPERVFERTWAQTVLRRTLHRLREEQEHVGRGAQFELLKPLLMAEAEVSQRSAAARMGLSESAVKMAVFRLRRRYKELLRAEIAETVRDPDQADEEMQYLLTALQQF
jgi:RNA polymerase sigma-70 factor (ECF subfamily)